MEKDNTYREMMRAAGHLNYTEWFRKYKEKLWALWIANRISHPTSDTAYRDWCEWKYDSV